MKNKKPQFERHENTVKGVEKLMEVYHAHVARGRHFISWEVIEKTLGGSRDNNVIKNIIQRWRDDVLAICGTYPKAARGCGINLLTSKQTLDQVPQDQMRQAKRGYSRGAKRVRLGTQDDQLSDFDLNRRAAALEQLAGGEAACTEAMRRMEAMRTGEQSDSDWDALHPKKHN